VAIPAVMMFNYLTGRVEAFDVEMDNSSSELIDYPEAPGTAARSSYGVRTTSRVMALLRKATTSELLIWRRAEVRRQVQKQETLRIVLSPGGQQRPAEET
jgi:hypothetical protein